MNDTEIQEIATLLPAPAAPPMGADRSLALRAHMINELRSAPARRVRRTRRVWAGLGVTLAAGAAAAVAATVLVASPGTPHGVNPPTAGETTPGSANGPLTAATLLAKVADAAARQPAPQVSDNEFMYIRSEVAYPVDTITNGHETVTMEKPHERQIWLPVANVCGAGLLIENGQRTPLGGSASSGNGPGLSPRCGEGTVNGPTYRLLQSLPTDPRTLLTYIYAQTKGEGQSQGRDGEAFITIGDMIRESVVPPKAAAALYRAAALIPGVTLVPHVTNAVGQPGVGVARAGYEWIFNPVTYQYIGEQDGTGGSGGSTAVLQKAIVPVLGQVPPQDH